MNSKKAKCSRLVQNEEWQTGFGLTFILADFLHAFLSDFLYDFFGKQKKKIKVDQ